MTFYLVLGIMAYFFCGFFIFAASVMRGEHPKWWEYLLAAPYFLMRNLTK